MLNGKELILATRPYAKEIRRNSWQETGWTFLLLFIFTAGICWLPFLIFRIFCSLMAGMLLIRMFIIYHDYEHHAILTGSKPASFLMKAFGIFILSPSSIWKRSHDHHHKHNSKLFSASIGSYPIATKQKYLLMSRSERFKYLVTRHPLTIALGYFTMFIFGMCIASFISSPRKHWDSLVALVLHVSASMLIFIYFGGQTWFLLFFLPFLIAFAMGSYLFYAQHNFPGARFAGNNDWAYEKAAMESSSYMEMHPIMAWLTGNIGYHHIHHLNARIPFYRLPEVMRQIPELNNCRRTSLSPRDIWACLRLKVWDPEVGSMIGLRDIREDSLAPA